MQEQLEVFAKIQLVELLRLDLVFQVLGEGCSIKLGSTICSPAPMSFINGIFEVLQKRLLRRGNGVDCARDRVGVRPSILFGKRSAEDILEVILSVLSPNDVFGMSGK